MNFGLQDLPLQGTNRSVQGGLLNSSQLDTHQATSVNIRWSNYVFLLARELKDQTKIHPSLTKNLPKLQVKSTLQFLTQVNLNLRLVVLFLRLFVMLCFVCLWYVTFHPRENVIPDQFQIILKSLQHIWTGLLLCGFIHALRSQNSLVQHRQ